MFILDQYIDWPHLDRLQAEILESQSDYDTIKRDHAHFDAQIQEALGDDYYRYDDALGAYLALHSRAAMLTGAHAALRLLISLL